eukprot:IDg17739t1
MHVIPSLPQSLSADLPRIKSIVIQNQAAAGSRGTSPTIESKRATSQTPSQRTSTDVYPAKSQTPRKRPRRIIRESPPTDSQEEHEKGRVSNGDDHAANQPEEKAHDSMPEPTIPPAALSLPISPTPTVPHLAQSQPASPMQVALPPEQCQSPSSMLTIPPPEHCQSPSSLFTMPPPAQSLPTSPMQVIPMQNLPTELPRVEPPAEENEPIAVSRGTSPAIESKRV